MTPDQLSAAFALPETTYSHLRGGEVIPVQFHSSLAPGDTRARHSYAPGIGRAVALLLLGQVQLYPGPNDGSEETTTAAALTAQLHPNYVVRYVHAGAQHTLNLFGSGEVWLEECVVGPFMAALILGLLGNERFKVPALEFRRLLERVRHWPLREGEVAPLAESDTLKGHLMTLTHTLYYAVKAQLLGFHLDLTPHGSGTASPLTAEAQKLPLGALLKLEISETQKTLSPTLEALMLLERGGSALLYGPSGTFKTESGKALALELGAHLVLMKGDPSVEARDFKGGAHAEGARSLPLPEGDHLPDLLRGLISATHAQNPFQWRDGPLAQAFVLAQGGRTVLLIDEVLRFQGEELGVLMGAMDTVSTNELKAQGLEPGEVRPDYGGRYHLLKLPNEEVLFCPTEHLIWVLTTNVGRDYVQAGTRLDAALRSRIDLCLYLEAPDPKTLRGVLESVCQDSTLVETMLSLDAFVRAELAAPGCIFLRPLDARKLIALLRTTQTLESKGRARREALCEALKWVAAPFLGDLQRPDEGAALQRRLKTEVLKFLAQAESGQSGVRSHTRTAVGA